MRVLTAKQCIMSYAWDCLSYDSAECMVRAAYRCSVRRARKLLEHCRNWGPVASGQRMTVIAYRFDGRYVLLSV